MDEEASGNKGISWDFLRSPIKEVPALQIGGGYEVLRKVRFPDAQGAGIAQDRRLHLDVATLERMLKIARSSPTLRCVVHGIQVEVTQFRTPNGHIFESWSFAGYPVPEGSLRDTTALADAGQVRRRAEEGK